MKSKVRIISAIVFCIYLVAVSILCFMKTDGTSFPDYEIFGIGIDKIGHLIMFIPFTALGYLTFAGQWKQIWKHFILLGGIILFGVAVASGTEMAQGLLGYRSSDIWDFIADLSGMATGGIITSAFILYKTKRIK